MGYEYSIPNIAQGRFINMIRTPSKQWGMCDNYSETTLLEVMVTKPIDLFRYFPDFSLLSNTGYPLNVTFYFHQM